MLGLHGLLTRWDELAHEPWLCTLLDIEENSNRYADLLFEVVTQRYMKAPTLILYPPSLEYIGAFFGCLYAGVIAVPAYPPDPSRLQRTLPPSRRRWSPQ